MTAPLAPPLAALDLGSNTLKITVARVGADGALEVLGEDARITRVGEGLDRTGRVSNAAMERTLQGLRALVDFARARGATEIACVGTAGLRGAENADTFLARAKAECGLEVEIIHGLREAELAFRAPASAFGPGPILVADIGGRSTEIIAGSAEGITARISLEIGSVRLTERFFSHDPPTREERHALEAFLATELQRAPEPGGAVRLVGVSGTVQSLMGLALDLDDAEVAVARSEGAALTRAELARILEDLASKPARARIRGTVLPEGRADVIVAGAHILLAIIDRYGLDQVLVSNRGVRYGLLLERADRRPA